MADINKLIPFIFKWEGGFVNDPSDKGGPTNRGVTLQTWQELGIDKNGDGTIDPADLKLITQQEAVNRVLKPFWDRWKADDIRNQSIANILVDWVWMSGIHGIKIPQRIVGVKADGIAGKLTLDAVNAFPGQRRLFGLIRQARVDYINRICRSRPANNRFKRGWLNRLNDLTFITLALILCASCKSIPDRVQSKEKLQSVTKSEVRITRPETEVRNEVFVSEAGKETEKESTQQSLTFQYDTSLPPDPETGLHPVSEIRYSVKSTTSNKSTRSKNDRLSSTVRQTELTVESSARTSSEKQSEFKEQPGQDPYRWRYVAVAVVIVALAVVVVWWKRYVKERFN